MIEQEDPYIGDAPEEYPDNVNEEYADGSNEEYDDNSAEQYGEQFAGSAISRTMDRMQSCNQFEGENYNYLTSLRTPLIADDLLTRVKNSSFLQSTQKGLCGLIDIFISTDTLLANIENMNLAILYFRISLTEVTATAPRCDTTSRQYMRITALLEMAVRVVFTRTHGAYRERRLQDMNRAEVVTGKLTPSQQLSQPSNGRTLFQLPIRRR